MNQNKKMGESMYQRLNVVQIEKQKQLDEKLLKHDFSCKERYTQAYASAKRMAENYASVENALVVLSNMMLDVCYICYGRLGRAMGLGETNEEVDSIWEKKVLDHVHPDDVTEKITRELQFHSFIMQQPINQRPNYYMQHLVRIETSQGNYLTLRHRILYLDYDDSGNLLLTLCLYNVIKENAGPTGIICSMDDTLVKESNIIMHGLLTGRECEILELIRQGLASKQIADQLCISANTVNNHRQNIMHKLHCKNTTEAIDVARRLGLLPQK